MKTRFEAQRDDLELQVTVLRGRNRALFLLVYAQRFAPLFRRFESRAKFASTGFDSVLDGLWLSAKGSKSNGRLGEDLLRLIPGEDWVVGGFYDAIAQYVGGLAMGALEGLESHAGIDGTPEVGVFDILRLLLSEMRLSCSDPGDTPDGVKFESELHKDQIVVDEAQFWRRLLSKLAPDAVAIDDLQEFAVANSFDPVRLEPELSRGLAQDARDGSRRS